MNNEYLTYTCTFIAHKAIHSDTMACLHNVRNMTREKLFSQLIQQLQRKICLVYEHCCSPGPLISSEIAFVCMYMYVAKMPRSSSHNPIRHCAGNLFCLSDAPATIGRRRPARPDPHNGASAPRRMLNSLPALIRKEIAQAS